MEILEALRTRRTVHKYKPQPVSAELIEEALEAALWAPNHKLTFPFRFTWVGPETRKKIADLAVRFKFPEGNATPEQAESVKASILNPAHLIAFRCLKNADPVRFREDYATLSCAIQNFSLALHARGIGTKWSTGKPSRSDETYKILGIDPAKEEIIGFVWAGVPEAVPQAPKRPALQELCERLP